MDPDGTPPRFLTKSTFARGQGCLRRAWLDAYRPDLRPAHDEDLKARIETGHAVGLLARQRYPHGRPVSASFDPTEAGWETSRLIQDGAACLFEATIVAGTRAARLDVLSRRDDGWVIDEVKSSSRVKDEHVRELAFQVMVAEDAGLAVDAARLVLVDTQYAWNGGDYDPGAMLQTEDVTEACLTALAEVRDETDALARTLNMTQEPAAPINTHCKDCDYCTHCLRSQGAHPVVYLPGIRSKAVNDLHAAGYTSIEQISDSVKLSPRHRLVRDVVVSGVPHISPDLGRALGAVEFPAAFIDYESVNPAFPWALGTRPYQQVCFQWSAHVLASPNAPPVHREFLADSKDDPRGEFCRTLCDVVEGCNSVVHYHHFDVTQMRKMFGDGVPLARELLNILVERAVDLEAIVREHVYYPGFHGRTSIKVVLPTLVPGLSYEGMAVSNGTAAGAAFLKMLDAESGPEREFLRRSLLEYCGLDTLAMVRIYEVLCALS